MQLDVAMLIAGARERGELETRVADLLEHLTAPVATEQPSAKPAVTVASAGGGFSAVMAGKQSGGSGSSAVATGVAVPQPPPRTILVIDEIHTLVGAGSVQRGGVVGSPGLDISNLLKPALAGRLQCIGATTVDEHRMHVMSDAALNRRFQPVNVAEPSCEAALQVRRWSLCFFELCRTYGRLTSNLLDAHL